MDATPNSSAANRRSERTALGGISVVVPTFRRVELTRRLLRSLADARTRAATATQIIIVDSSPAEDANRLKRACQDCGAEYHPCQNHVSAKRNLGARLARHDIILFIDDDCEASPQLLNEHLALYRRSDAVVGVIGPTEFKGPQSVVWRAVAHSPFVRPFQFAFDDAPHVWGPSNNLSVRRAVFDQIGGFDESFTPKPGAEDVDFGFRLAESGRLFHSAPRAVVYHTTETWNTFGQMLSRVFNWGRGEFHIFFNYPEYMHYSVSSPLAICLLLLPASLLGTLTSGRAAWLLLPLIFLANATVIRIVAQARQHPSRSAIVVDSPLVIFFVLVFELGLIVESLKHRWIFPMFHVVFFTAEDAMNQWNLRFADFLFLFMNLILSVALADGLAHLG